MIEKLKKLTKYQSCFVFVLHKRKNITLVLSVIFNFPLNKTITEDLNRSESQLYLILIKIKI